MSINQRSSHGIAATVLALALGCSSAAAYAEDSGGQETRGVIRIEYVPPKNPDHQKIYDLLQKRQALEKVRTMLGPFRFPIDVKVQSIGCDGASNAWYQREDGKPTVSLCYEYVKEILDKMPTEMPVSGVTAWDAVVGQFYFAVFHEFGHLAFDVFDIPVFGREEDAADEFATYIMLQFQGDQQYRLIAGAAYAYHEFIKDYKNKPKVTVPLAVFSSDHGLPEERFANLLCIAYGADSKVFAVVVENEYLPKSRAKRCRYEYLVLRYAFRQLIVPHVDMDAAKQVLNTRWLAEIDASPTKRSILVTQP